MNPEALQRYVVFLEGMHAGNVADLGSVMTDDARFVDPFNDVTGIDHVRRVYDHLFENIAEVRFKVTHAALDRADPHAALIRWDLDGLMGDQPWHVSGMSELRLSDDGRVSLHIDHWDSGRQFYERLPLIGWLLRKIRRRLTVA